jgi:hypothetical protein
MSLSLRLLEFQMKNAFVFQKKYQIGAARQGDGQFSIQDLAHGNAAGEFIQKAGVLPLEQLLHHQIVIADILGWHEKTKGPRA